MSRGEGRSLQRTLAVRFALTMSAGLLGLGVLAYAGVRSVLAEEMDSALRATYQLQADALLERGRLPSHQTRPDGAAFLREVNRLVVVRDSAGRMLQANFPMISAVPLERSTFQAALAGRLAFADGTVAGQGARALYGPALPGTPGSAAVIEVLAVSAGGDAAALRFLVGTVATALVAGLAALVGAWFLARSALAPVAEIATQAELVREPTPSRITVHADVRELRGLVRVLNGMLERLDRYFDWHRNIIRDLGHDLRTPLATLRAGAELALVTERTPEEYRRVLGQSLEEVDRLTLISDALRLLGRLQWGELVPVRVPVDLREVVGIAVGRARERSGGRVVAYPPSDGPVEAEADATLIACALDQVLDNAIRHTGPETHIVVQVVADPDGARIVIEDDGEGVSPEILPHLFEPFYRGDPARGRHGGAGLGLTTVAAIVRAHQGQVVAGPADRGGLRVTIQLPVPAQAPMLASASTS